MKPHQLNNLVAVFAVGLALGFPSGCGNEAVKKDSATPSHDHVTAVAAAPAEQSEPADRRDQLTRPGEEHLNEFQPPDKIMDAIGLKAGMVIGEIGAGWGRFTVHLAKRVGDAGQVYANDIEKGVLSLLDQRIKTAGLANVRIIVGEVHDPLFPPGSLDIAFMINVYNAFEDPVRFLRNIAPALKPGGKLAIVLDDPAKSGGESAKSATREQFLSVVGKAGYRVEKEETFLVRDGLYVLAVKPAQSPVIGTKGLVSAAHPLAADPRGRGAAVAY